MENHTNEWIWVVAGGIMQIPLIQEIKRRGYKILVSDKNPNAPGMKHADLALNIDTYDVDAHVSVATGIAKTKSVRAVLTAGADVGPTVSAIAETLSLPAESLQVAQTARNKASFRKAFRQNHPAYLEVMPNEDSPQSRWKNKCNAGGIPPYPCIVKPLESSATRGITLVESPWKLGAAIRFASKYNKNRHVPVLIEEYIKGDTEVALDFFMYEENLILANAACRIFRHKNKPGFEIGHINPWKPPRELIRIARQAASAIGLKFGPFKIDFIHDERGWFALEAATRLSGGFDHMYTCPIATGKDVTGVMLDLALGLPLNKEKLKSTKDNYACAYSPTLLPGKVESWLTDDVKNSPGVEKIFITHETEIPTIEHCASRPIFIITSGKSPMGAFRNAVRASRLLGVQYK